MYPAFPRSELLLVCCHYLNLEVVFEVLEEVVLLKESRPAYSARTTQELVTNVDTTRELILRIV